MKRTNPHLKIAQAILAIGAVISPRWWVAAAPAAQAPAVVSASASKPDISPEARRELEALRGAYAKLKSLQLHGVMSGWMELAGKKQSQRVEFDSAFLAPNRFKYASVPTAGDPIATTFGSTGIRLYWGMGGSDGGRYSTEDGAKNLHEIEKTDEQADGQIWFRLKIAADPGLKLAMAADAGAMLVNDASRVVKDADVTLEGKTYASLTFTSQSIRTTTLVDRQTHLLRRITLDGKQTENGMTSSARFSYDYPTIHADSPALNDAYFAWTPPAGAKEILTAEQISATLTGRAAPDVTLDGTDGAAVRVSSLKGSVVVLDFWATWCGPCVQSLPHLNQLWEEKHAGLKVFAVDEREPKETITRFIASKHYTFPVLMDSDSAAAPAHDTGFGAAANAYTVSGIPQTVIIGKDGKVKTVLVGYGPDSEAKLRAAVEAALAER